MYGKGGFWTDDDHGTHVEQSNARKAASDDPDRALWRVPRE